MKFFENEAVRFLGVGATNTIVTYLLYLLLLHVLSYRVAYSTTFAIGIVLAYTLNTRYVFRGTWQWKRLAAYPLVYVVQYVLGLFLLTLLVERGWANEQLAPLVVVVLSLPVVFIMSRLIIKARNP
jgi:putative flippase GtrA